MTKPLPPHQHTRSTLSHPKFNRGIQWDAGMVDALEDCVRRDMTIHQTMQRLGITDHALARGLALRLQQFLGGPEAGHD